MHLQVLQILSFLRTTSDTCTFVILFHRLLKRIQEQEVKHGSINIYAEQNLRKTHCFQWFSRHSSKLHQNFFIALSQSYIYATLLVAWSVSAFCFLFVCLFISLCGCNFVIASILSVFVSIYLDLFMFQRIENLHYNFTLI